MQALHFGQESFLLLESLAFKLGLFDETLLLKVLCKELKSFIFATHSPNLLLKLLELQMLLVLSIFIILLNLAKLRPQALLSLQCEDLLVVASRPFCLDPQLSLLLERDAFDEDFFKNWPQINSGESHSNIAGFYDLFLHWFNLNRISCA
jgi:hypothetical protein